MEEIKSLRERRNLTQKELAEKVSVERSTVAKWESGAAFPSAAKLPKLAEVLECSVADLFPKTAAPA